MWLQSGAARFWRWWQLPRKGNKRKNLSDSLDFYNKIDANAKLSVYTLSDSDLLRVGSSFLSEQSKIRIDLIPTVASLNEELKAVNHTIDSLSKMK